MDGGNGTTGRGVAIIEQHGVPWRDAQPAIAELLQVIDHDAEDASWGRVRPRRGRGVLRGVHGGCGLLWVSGAV